MLAVTVNSKASAYYSNIVMSMYIKSSREMWHDSKVCPFDSTQQICRDLLRKTRVLLRCMVCRLWLPWRGSMIPREHTVYDRSGELERERQALN